VGQLRNALQRAPVTLVWGLSGLGKTALVYHTLHTYYPERVGHTLVITRRAEEGDDLRLDVARALSLVSPDADLDWERPDRDLEDLLGQCIDIAEEEGWWFVLEDIHRADLSQVADLLSQIARYARQSRWIAVSGENLLLPELAGQVVTLSEMDEADLVRVARLWNPSAQQTDVRQAVAASAGSPGQLQKLLLKPRASAKPVQASLFEGLDGRALDLLKALSLIERPLPLDVIVGFSDLPESEVLEMLERRGLIEDATGGFRLHAVARPLVKTSMTPEDEVERRRRTLQALSSHERPVAVLEAVRLLLSQGQVGETEALLDRRGDELLARGHAGELWRYLEPVADERLGRWRLKCALSSGDFRALSMVREPKSATLHDRYLAARAMFGRGEWSGALEALRPLVEQATAAQDLALALETRLLIAQCSMMGGHAEDGLRELEAIEPSSADERARRDALTSSALALLGRVDEASVVAERVQASLSTLTPTAKAEAGLVVAQVYFELGRLRDASDLLDTLKNTGEGRDPTLHVGRRVLHLRAAIALDRGFLQDARRLLNRIRPPAASAVFKLALDLTDSQRRMAAGELKGLWESLASLRQLAKAQGQVPLQHLAQLLSLRMALLRARVPAELLAPLSAPVARATNLTLQILAAEARLRSGDTRMNDVAEPADVPELSGLRVQSKLIWGLSKLLDSDLKGALDETEDALQAARTSGYGVAEAEARLRVCEIHAVMNRRRDLAEAAKALVEQGTSLPSTRFALEGNFFQMAAAEGALSPSVLEEFAAYDDVAPTASRRARALLGEPVPLDAVDRSVLSALQRMNDWGEVSLVCRRAPEGVSATVDLPRWGLDDYRQEIWAKEGRRIELSQSPLLWRILEVMADHGGHASKEQLVIEVWNEREYHPLKHDNRLRLAVRKLRQDVEVNPARPSRILTTEDGYALAGLVRRLKRRPGSRPPPPAAG
jgi:hypothetical protein